MSVPVTAEVDPRELAASDRTISSSSNLSPISFEERLVERLAAADGGVAESLAQAQRLAGTHQEDLARIILRLELVSEQALSATLATLCGAPLADTSSVDAVPHCAGTLPLDFMREQGVLPLRECPEGVEVAFALPHDLAIHQSVELALGAPIKKRTATLSNIRQALERLYGDASSSDDEATDEASVLDDRSDFESTHLRDLASEAPVVRFVSHLIKRAVDARASDIHIEPFEHKAAIRLRIDGVLHPIDIAVGSLSAVISRIKLLSKLDIAERRLPQDGRLHVRVDGKHIELRASCVPTAHGESLVLRILDQAETRLAFEALGFSEQLQTEIERAIQTPHGIFLTTGPTGSGKSTTLYTALTALNDDTKKIITIEDPVERHLQGINQINVKPQIGLTVSSPWR